MGSKEKVFLTPEEKAKFAKALYDIHKSRPMLAWAECFKEAGKVLTKDRRAIAEKTHPSEVPWLNELYKGLEKNFGFMPALKPDVEQTTLGMAERVIFALKIHELRKTQPPTVWRECFIEANKLLPEGKKMSSGVDHPTKLTWLAPMLKDIEEHPKKYISAPVQMREQSPKTPTVQPQIHTKLNDAEKLIFAKAYLAALKANPDGGAANAIRMANSQMPEGRRIGAKIDSLNQISWIKPLLIKLQADENRSSSRAGKRQLNDEERTAFAKALYEIRKSNIDKGWKFAIQEANKSLPEEVRFNPKMDSPNQILWVKPMLDKLEKEDKARLVIDHRHIPAVPEPAPASVATSPEIKVIPAGESGKKGKKGPRTYLKPEEKMLFAEAVYRARITNLGWTGNQCMVEANKSLPEHRRFQKLPASIGQMPWLPPMLEVISKRPANSPDKIVPEPEGGYEIIPEESAAAAPATAPSLDMQAMMMAAFEKVAREQFAAAAAGGTNAVAPINGVKQESKPDLRKKVIVVGLLPVQTNEVQKEFGSFYNLRFFHANTPIPQIRDSMKNVDFAILMTRFVSHSMATAMRSHPGFLFCDGNSSALKMKLKEKLSQ